MTMKNVLHVTLAVSALTIPFTAARAQSLRAHIPFEFTANGTKLPAGDYEIGTLAGTPSVLMIAGAGMRAMLFARYAEPDSRPGFPLTFKELGADGRALSGIKTASGWLEIGVPTKARSSLAKTGLERRGAVALKEK